MNFNVNYFLSFFRALFEKYFQNIYNILFLLIKYFSAQKRNFSAEKVPHNAPPPQKDVEKLSALPAVRTVSRAYHVH